jgi:hypothetical protein
MSVAFDTEVLSPWDTILRMAEAADRLKDLGDEAEERGRIGDATRAVLAEARVLDLLLNMGAKGQGQFNYAADARALESAVAALLQKFPAAGEVLSAELERQERPGYANKIRVYANKCRALPEHQVSGNERPQELSYADH